MYAIILALLSAVAADPVAAVPAIDAAHDADAAVTERLNRAVTDHNQAIADENARRDAAYRAERARYEAALAENGKARAEADRARAAFEAAERQHADDMAAWRVAASGTRPSEPRPVAQAAPSRPTCNARDLTGSLVQKMRSCRR
jgi:hypothetical protein